MIVDWERAFYDQKEKLEVAREALEEVSKARRRTIFDLTPDQKEYKSILMIEYDNERADEALEKLK